MATQRSNDPDPLHLQVPWLPVLDPTQDGSVHQKIEETAHDGRRHKGGDQQVERRSVALRGVLVRRVVVRWGVQVIVDVHHG